MLKTKFINLSENKIVIAMFAILLILMISWRYYDKSMNAGDSVYIKQLVDNMSQGLGAKSDAQNAIHEILFSGLLTTTPKEICAMELGDKQEVDDLSSYHPYFALNVIAPFANLMPSELVLGIFTILGFISILFFGYRYLRICNIPIYAGIAVIFILMSHPAWSQAIQGQYYVERFYILTASILIWLMYQKNKNLVLIVIATILCLLVTERTGIVTGIFLILHPILYTDYEKKKRIAIFVIGAICLIYSYILINYYIVNHYYSSGGFLPTNIDHLIIRFSNFDFLSKLQVFSFYNIIFMGFLSIWDRKMFFIAVVMMFPNIIGNIGGAEKTGFLTHYHSLYTPFLFWSVVTGTVKIFQQEKINTRWINIILISLPLILFFSGIKGGNRIDFSVKNIYGNGFINAINKLPESFGDGYIAKINSINKRISDSIPDYASITTTEAGMPIVEYNHRLYYYPLGVDVADYAVLPYIEKDDKYYYIGATSYLGTKSQNDLNNCMNIRLKKEGYNVNNPLIIHDYAIIKRLVD